MDNASELCNIPPMMKSVWPKEVGKDTHELLLYGFCGLCGGVRGVRDEVLPDGTRMVSLWCPDCGLDCE